MAGLSEVEPETEVTTDVGTSLIQPRPDEFPPGPPVAMQCSSEQPRPNHALRCSVSEVFHCARVQFGFKLFCPHFPAPKNIFQKSTIARKYKVIRNFLQNSSFDGVMRCIYPPKERILDQSLSSALSQN
eukprot:717156_1